MTLSFVRTLAAAAVVSAGLSTAAQAQNYSFSCVSNNNATNCATGVAQLGMTVAQGAGFVNNMTAGAGYIALAALIFAKWRPVPAMFATLLFGFLDALQIRLQGVPLPLIGQIPVQFIQALPYVLTVILLAGFIGKAVGPKAGGVPYTKER